jgi:hypothetical protein
MSPSPAMRCRDRRDDISDSKQGWGKAERTKVLACCIIQLTSSCSFILHALLVLISQATNKKATSSKSYKVYGISKQRHS